MKSQILTEVIVKLVNNHININDYGVSMINIPDFDYETFISQISLERKIELYFLGFSSEFNVKL